MSGSNFKPILAQQTSPDRGHIRTWVGNKKAEYVLNQHFDGECPPNYYHVATEYISCDIPSQKESLYSDMKSSQCQTGENLVLW